MRHLEKEHEEAEELQAKIERDNKKGAEFMCQTDQDAVPMTEKAHSDKSFEAPPTPTETLRPSVQNGKDDSYEFEAKSSEKREGFEEYEDPDECEYRAPESKTDFFKQTAKQSNIQVFEVVDNEAQTQLPVVQTAGERAPPKLSNDKTE